VCVCVCVWCGGNRNRKWVWYTIKKLLFNIHGMNIKTTVRILTFIRPCIVIYFYSKTN